MIRVRFADSESWGYLARETKDNNELSSSGSRMKNIVVHCTLSTFTARKQKKQTSESGDQPSEEFIETM